MGEEERDTDDGPDRRRVGRIGRAALAVGVLALLTVRATLLFDDVANPDIAGILYNADLLREGGLPYVDSVELKQPGTFFLFAGVFALFGRSIEVLQLVYLAWIGIGAAAVWSAARTLGAAGRGAAWLPAVACALWLLSAGQFDWNYSAWMTVPYAWAFALLVRAFHRPGARLHVSAGALASIAILFKIHAVVLAPVFVGTWIWARRRGLTGARGAAPLWWLFGAALGVLPLVLVYAAHGELSALLDARLGLAHASGYSSWDLPFSWARLLFEIGRQHARVFQLGTVLAVIAIVEGIRAHRAGRDTGGLIPALLLWGFSVLAGGLGGPRFYAHYLVQDLPGLALLGAHVGVFRRLWPSPGAAGSLGLHVWTWTACFAAILAALWQLGEIAIGTGHRYDNVPRYYGQWTAPQAAGEYIRQHSAPTDTIFVWGLTAWPVYYWAERRAPTPVYKPMGQLTAFNTNTAFFPGGQIHARPGPAADAVIKAFREQPPAFFVHANPWPTMGCTFDPIVELPELVAEIEAHYVPVFAIGDLRVFARTEDAPETGP